jgi:hypothetical protein
MVFVALAEHPAEAVVWREDLAAKKNGSVG